MFDIDKYLTDIRIKECTPSDSLVKKTMETCEKLRKPRESMHSTKKSSMKFSKAAIIAVPAAAMLLIGILLGAFVFADRQDSSIVAFYTVDINPSICINVDENEIVKSVESQNEDAKQLLKTINCEGLSSPQAIELIIDAAIKEGYINDSNKYVLIGRFGNSNEQALQSLQQKLEAEINDMIQLLIVSGSFDDKQNADELNVSAGLLKLSQLADGIEIEDDSKVKDVVEEVSQLNQSKYKAPYIKANADESGITLVWDKLDFTSMGYTGEVVYNIMAAKTKNSFEAMTAAKIGELSFLSTDGQPDSFFADAESVISGEYKYYAVYADYYGDIYVKGNIIAASLPQPEPIDTPVVTPSPAQTQSPKPSATPEPVTDLVSGNVSGEYIKLSWQKNEKEGFLGYKIVASKTNEHPSYPEDGYLKYITDESTSQQISL